MAMWRQGGVPSRYDVNGLFSSRQINQLYDFIQESLF